MNTVKKKSFVQWNNIVDMAFIHPFSGVKNPRVLEIPKPEKRKYSDPSTIVIT